MGEKSGTNAPGDDTGVETHRGWGWLRERRRQLRLFAEQHIDHGGPLVRTMGESLQKSIELVTHRSHQVRKDRKAQHRPRWKNKPTPS